MRRRHHRVVDRDTLAHVGEIVLLESELTVHMHHEVDALVARVIELNQLLEFSHHPGEGVILVELARTVQCDIGRLHATDRKNEGSENCR